MLPSFASFRTSPIVSLAVLCALGTAGCSMSADALKKTIAANPEIITEAIEKNPEKFAKALQRASQAARRLAAEEQQKDMQNQQETDFKSPRKVSVEGRAVRGDKNAPVLIVAFSDFECPYCRMAHETIEKLREKYGDKLAYSYKHIPLNFHKMAMPAATRFEAIALQSSEKAFKFHDMVYTEQDKLKGGEAALDAMAKKVGVDMAQMKKAMKSEEVAKRIEKDQKEAQELDFSGTPAFVINGVRMRGAMPMPAFEQVIARFIDNGTTGGRDVTAK